MARMAGVHDLSVNHAFAECLTTLRPALSIHFRQMALPRLRRPHLSRVGALALALVLAVAAAGVVVPARVAAEAELARSAAVQQALGDGRAVATAIETYALEYGTFPRAEGATSLADALAPFLASGALADAAHSPFVYRLTPNGYRLDFTPGSDGIPVTVEVTAGTGGTATAGSAQAAIGW